MMRRRLFSIHFILAIFTLLIFNNMSFSATIYGNRVFTTENIMPTQELWWAGSYASIGLYSNGDPIIATNSTWPDAFRVATPSDSVWQIETIDDYPSVYHSLDVDSAGVVGISYQDHYTPYELRYAYKQQNGSWEIDTVANRGVGDTAFSFGTDDIPRLAYNDGGAGDIYYYQKNTNGSWSETYIGDSRIGGQRNIVDLGLDGSNNPYVLWASNRLWDPNGYRTGLLLSYYDGNVWNEEIVSSDASPIALFDVSTDGSSHLLIKENQLLKYKVLANGQWSEEIISANATGLDIEIGADGNPRIVYRENNQLIFGERSGTDWIISSLGADAFDIDLTLAPDGSSFIAAIEQNGSYFETKLYTSVVPEPVSSILFLTGGSLLAGQRLIKRKKRT